jgi:hypothetical protein
MLNRLGTKIINNTGSKLLVNGDQVANIWILYVQGYLSTVGRLLMFEFHVKTTYKAKAVPLHAMEALSPAHS